MCIIAACAAMSASTAATAKLGLALFQAAVASPGGAAVCAFTEVSTGGRPKKEGDCGLIKSDGEQTVDASSSNSVWIVKH